MRHIPLVLRLSNDLEEAEAIFRCRLRGLSFGKVGILPVSMLAVMRDAWYVMRVMLSKTSDGIAGERLHGLSIAAAVTCGQDEAMRCSRRWCPASIAMLSTRSLRSRGAGLRVQGTLCASPPTSHTARSGRKSTWLRVRRPHPTRTLPSAQTQLTGSFLRFAARSSSSATAALAVALRFESILAQLWATIRVGRQLSRGASCVLGTFCVRRRRVVGGGRRDR